MADVFISYSHRDKARADEVVSRVEARGWTVWIDDGLKGGEEFRAQIGSELEAAGVVLVLWSASSIESRWCRDEADVALGHKPPKLLAARLDDVLPPLGMRQDHAIGLLNLRPGEEHPGIDTLLAQLQARLHKTEPELVNLHAEAWRRLKKRVRETRTSILLAIGFAFALIHLVAADVPNGVPRMRLLSLQARHAVAAVTPSDAVRVVVIDRASEAALANTNVGEHRAGAFGTIWRSFHARVIEHLVAAGAKVIAFDIGFADTGANGPDNPDALATTELARAITAARTAGTAVFVLAYRREANGKLAIQNEIAAALENRQLPGLGGWAHGCMGEQVGWANLAPLVLTAPDEVLYALHLVSFSALEGRAPAWDPVAERLTHVMPHKSSQEIPFSGLDAGFKPDASRCGVAVAGERAVLRVIEPFPRELRRSDPRVIPFEAVFANTFDPRDIAGRIVLVGKLVENEDRRQVCDGDGCRDIGGLSLHAAAIDTLFQPVAIQVISPVLQLLWVIVCCSAVAWLRFAGARSSKLFRFGTLAGIMLCDVALAVYLAAAHAVLVDTLHHMFAMAATYWLVTRIEPVFTERARSVDRAAPL